MLIQLINKISLFIIISLLICYGCSPNRLKVDVSDIEIKPLEVLRLEKDLFSLNEANIDAKTTEIKNRYGVYYNHYLINFLCRTGTEDSMYKRSVLNFVRDKDTKGAFNGVEKIYSDSKIEDITAQVNDCIKRFKFHFPSKALPKRLITCTAGWNYAFAYMDSSLVISLDMYLGDTSTYYQMLRYPQYQVRKMSPNYIVPDIVRGWLLTEFDNSNAESTLLAHTIFYGKLFYAASALLPDANDSLIIGYTGKQLGFCKEFEKKLWGYFAEKNRLYENNLNTVRELTTDGPFTGAIHKDCPPRIAMWVGWQIVKSYMNNNQEITLEELMKEKNSQKILSKSKYRP